MTATIVDVDTQAIILDDLDWQPACEMRCEAGRPPATLHYTYRLPCHSGDHLSCTACRDRKHRETQEHDLIVCSRCQSYQDIDDFHFDFTPLDH